MSQIKIYPIFFPLKGGCVWSWQVRSPVMVFHLLPLECRKPADVLSLLSSLASKYVIRNLGVGLVLTQTKDQSSTASSRSAPDFPSTIVIDGEDRLRTALLGGENLVVSGDRNKSDWGAVHVGFTVSWSYADSASNAVGIFWWVWFGISRSKLQVLDVGRNQVELRDMRTVHHWTTVPAVDLET